MAIHEVFMPALSSTMTEGKIVDWLKAPGDKVTKGETVLVVESDKADMDVESFYEGYLATIISPAGAMAPVGEAIALIAETEAEIEQAKQLAAGKAQPAASPAVSTSAAAQPVAAPAAAGAVPAPAPPLAAPGNGRVVASPRARKLAKNLGVDLATLSGSGPHGRVVAADVEAVAGVTKITPVAVPALAVPPPTAGPTGSVLQAAPPVPGQVVPLNTLQQAVVRNMNASLSVPVFHVSYTITTDALDKLYKQLKSKGVTMSALLAKACALALAKHPIVNACYTDAGIQYNASINVAIAVAMDDGGLLTPVLPSADKADLYSISRAWADLVARARIKQLKPEEYSTGTFTISNLGMFGVDTFDAILPPGTGAILAIGASKPTVVATDDGLFGLRRQMTVNLTCDHRTIYGAQAAAFLKDLAHLIETNPQSLTL